LDADGQTPWAWAEAKGDESMMEILSEYGGGPSAVWSIQVEPSSNETGQEIAVVAPWSSAVLKSFVSAESDEGKSVVCTNLAGETMFRCRFPKDVLVEDVFARITRDTGKAVTLILPNNYILGLSDHHLALGDLLDSPPNSEKRKDPKNGLSYTKLEFYKYYGKEQGRDMWAMAAPDEFDVACAQSLADLAAVENTMISEAVFRSLRESDGGKDEVLQILVMGFNKHPIDFTNAISESALAQSLMMRAVNISPEWANGAKVLIEGLTPEMMEKGDPPFDPDDLRRSHVVALPENEKDILESLRGLSYRMRPRTKTRNIVTCKKPPSKDPQRDGSARDGSESCEAHEGEEEEGYFVEEEPQCFQPGLPEHLCVTRTFIDVPSYIRVGLSPRSVYTKSSTDKHGIENPRKWK